MAKPLPPRRENYPAMPYLSVNTSTGGTIYTGSADQTICTMGRPMMISQNLDLISFPVLAIKTVSTLEKSLNSAFQSKQSDWDQH
jgi:hypothetical protein